MRLNRLLTGVSVASDVLGAVKVAAVGLAVLGVFGFGYAGCISLINAGYSKAEADRLEDLAAQNAEAAEKLRADHAAAKSAERRYREARDRALAAARDARKAVPATEGGVCPKDCRYSP